MYNGPQDVSGNVSRPSDINFAFGISRNDNTNIGKLIFQKSGYVWIHGICIHEMESYGGPGARMTRAPGPMGQGPGPRRQFWARAWLLGPHMYPFYYVVFWTMVVPFYTTFELLQQDGTHAIRAKDAIAKTCMRGTK